MSRLALILTAYALFSLLWGAGLIGEGIGDGTPLVVILGVVHLGLGAGVGRPYAVALPLFPVVVAVASGSEIAGDDAWGYLVFVYVGAAAVVLVGVVGGRLVRWWFRRRSASAQAA